jgi:hypothetical protein
MKILIIKISIDICLLINHIVNTHFFEGKYMKYMVIENHRTEFSNPITLKQGEKVILGEESEDETMPNWIFCKKMDDSNEGWVPKQIIKNQNNYGEIIEDYSAKELDIDKKTIVEGIKELNGWLWLKNIQTNEIGWVPINNLRKID